MTHIIASAILALVGVSALYATWSTYRSANRITGPGALVLATGALLGVDSLVVAWSLV